MYLVVYGGLGAGSHYTFDRQLEILHPLIYFPNVHRVGVDQVYTGRPAELRPQLPHVW